MPRVLNKYRDYISPEAVYIGRGSPWGNKFRIGQDGTRDEVCEKHKQYVLANPSLIQYIKTFLKGKDLWCYCAPLKCHGDFLLKIANEEEEK